MFIPLEIKIFYCKGKNFNFVAAQLTFGVPTHQKDIDKTHIQLLSGLIVSLFHVKDLFSVAALCFRHLQTGLKFVEYFGSVVSSRNTR